MSSAWFERGMKACDEGLDITKRLIDSMPKYPYLAEVVDACTPFYVGQIVAILGELANMPGHVVLATRADGHVFIGYHAERFRKLDRDET